ncbi:MAG: hypothetical protein WCC66_07875, partial [Rhizobiaceae bacterium]
MAKPVAKDDKKKAGSGVSSIVKLLPIVSLVLASLFAFLLAAATLDLHFLDLRPALHGLEAVFASLLLGACHLYIFAASKASAAGFAGQASAMIALRDEFEALALAHKASIDEAAGVHRTQAAASIKEITQKVDAFIGGEHARLKDENEKLLGELRGLHKSDADKVAEEIEAL